MFFENLRVKVKKDIIGLIREVKRLMEFVKLRSYGTLS